MANKSKATILLEKVHNKSEFIKNNQRITREFNALNQQMGITGPSLDLCGAALNVSYDHQTIDDFVEEMKQREDLVILNISAHKYNCKEFFERVKFPNLQALSADNIGDYTPEDLSALLSACPSLKVLDLIFTFMENGSGFKDIHTKCPNLKWLRITCRDKSTTLPHLVKCESLISLDFETFYGGVAYALNDEEIEQIVAMPNLKECKIYYSNQITARGIELLRRKPTFKLVGFPMSAIIDNFGATTKEYQVSEQITREEFTKILANATNLTKLQFNSFNKKLNTNEALEELGRSACASTLENLDVSIQSINNRGMTAIGKLRNLKVLNMALVWQTINPPSKISDDVLIAASKGWVQLEDLDIQFAPLSLHTIEQVVLNCPKLKKMNMTGCCPDTEDMVMFDYAIQSSAILSRVKINHKRR